MAQDPSAPNTSHDRTKPSSSPAKAGGVMQAIRSVFAAVSKGHAPQHPAVSPPSDSVPSRSAETNEKPIFREMQVGDSLDSSKLPERTPHRYAYSSVYERELKGEPSPAKQEAPPFRKPVRLFSRAFWYGIVGEYAGRLWVRIALSAFGLLMLTLLVYQIYLAYYTDIKTETADISVYSDTIDVEGIAIRNEELIYGDVGESAVNAVANGEKVSAGQAVIHLFSSSKEAAAYTRLAEIEAEIAVLKSMVSASEDSADVVNNIDKLIAEQAVELTESVNKGDLSDLEGMKSNFAYLFNKRLIAMRKVEDYSDRITELEQEMQSLQASFPRALNAIQAPSSGYFVNTPDGYETLLTPSMLDELTADKLQELMKRKVTVPDNAVGKLVKDFSWYIACPVPKAKAEDYLSVDSIYTLLLPYSETGSVQANLVYLNEDESDTCLAVFQCTSLISELCGMRRQPVKIQIRSYRGFNIKKSALHVNVKTVSMTDVSKTDIDESQFTEEVRTSVVYIVVGNQVVAKQVDILYNGDTFVICSASQTDSAYLTRYDEVITEGKGLYAGKIISRKR